MSENPAPLVFQWDGEAMWPKWRKRADQEYVIGATYRLGVIADRSQISHNHFFASVAEAWSNLPEELAERFPTSEHLRKHALIKAGYHDAKEFVCGSKAEAVRLAAFLRPIDEYAVVIVRENVVRHLTAKSQSKKAMGAADFQASKQAVLDYVASLIGTTGTGALEIEVEPITIDDLDPPNLTPRAGEI